MHEEGERAGEREDEFGLGTGAEAEVFESMRLGHDIRFILAAVGGGGIRVARTIARKQLPYLETVAINCDPRVHELEEFDRRICLGPESGLGPDAQGSPQVGGDLARSAGPALQRLFEGATCVAIIASLGGGTGTGALPHVLEAAARSAPVLKVFAIKPFACEGDRRSVADRTLARLHFIESFVDRRERGQASLQILDNESLATQHRTLPIARLDRYWGDLVAHLIERELLEPAEAVLRSERAAILSRHVGIGAIPRPVRDDEVPFAPEPMAPAGPRLAPTAARADGVELTIEVFPSLERDGPDPPGAIGPSGGPSAESL